MAVELRRKEREKRHQDREHLERIERVERTSYRNDAADAGDAAVKDTPSTAGPPPLMNDSKRYDVIHAFELLSSET